MVEMTSTTTTDRAFPWPRVCPFAPPAQYARLREEQPIAQVELPSGEQVWVITRYDHFRKVLSDSRFSSEHSHPGFPAIFPVVRHRDEEGVPPKLTYSGMDPPEHTFHRRMVATEFTVKRIANLRPYIQQIVDEHVQAMLDRAGPVDLVKTLAEPITSQVISELLGVPHETRVVFQELSRIVLDRSSSPGPLETASAELKALLSKLLADKEASPRDDLLGRLICKYRSSKCYDHEQMIQFAGALVTAGHETTANMISLGTAALLEHPDQLAELTNNASLFGRSVEELLRYLSIADMVTARVALADVEIDGITIHAGEGLIALGAAANRDPRAFTCPEVFDIHRVSSHHLAFGYGIHNCLGQHLARLELEVVFTTLFKRIPGLRLAINAEDLWIKENGVIYGVQALPVTW
jgi:cytochrome P450